MTIVPDTKNWTWVLERRCPDCGFEAATVPLDDLAPQARDIARRWEAVLARADVRVRPDPSVWSPLEYGCHVRDVLRLADVRLARMLAEDGPRFADWDQDATAIEDRYGEQDPAVVRVELRGAGDALADRFASVQDGQWARPGTRSDGARFTVASFGRYLLHDPVHHLWDVGEAS